MAGSPPQSPSRTPARLWEKVRLNRETRSWPKLARRVRDQEQLRQCLEEQVKPLFDKHGQMGVGIGELQDELAETDIVRSVPPKRLKVLIQRADSDKNEYITYEEFSDMMLDPSTLSRNEKTAFRKFINNAISNIVPFSERHDFLQQYTLQKALRPPPFFMILISVVEIAVFIYYAKELAKEGIPVTWTTGLIHYSPFPYKPTRRYEAWRYVSYLLMHHGYQHLIGNLFYQLFFGLLLELVHKWWRVAMIFFIGVIAGSLAHSVVDHDTILVGASGGCYALIGGHFASIVLNWSEMNHDCCESNSSVNPVRFVCSAPCRLIVLFLAAGIDTGFAAYRRFANPMDNQVGMSAHVGGLLAGLLVGVPILKNINVLPWEKRAGVVTLIIFLICVAAAAMFNIFYTGYPPTDWSECCP